MFRKNKNEFGDKNYKMKEYYEADNLIVAKLQIISGDYIEDGPMIETTEQKYIFEIIREKQKIRYREIFTGFITDNIDDTKENNINFHYFNLPYVYKPEKFTDYFPQTKGELIPKLSFLWILNDLNYSKKNEEEITKKKTTFEK